MTWDALLVTGLLSGQAAVLSESTDVLGYAVLALVGAAGFLLYVARPALALLVTAVSSVTLVVPQLSADLTDGVLGREGTAVMAGLALVASGLAAWRLHEEYGRP